MILDGVTVGYNKISMDALINEGKTKGFNCMLRVFHYSLLLLIVNRGTNASMMLCSDPATAYHHISYIIALVILGLSIVGVCYIHFKYQFPRVEFFAGLVVEMLLVLAIMWYSFSSMSARQRECSQIILLEKWAIFASFRLFIEILLIMVSNIFWVQRYTNGPGNLTWTYMFMTINWSAAPQVKTLFVAIGVTYLLISLITLVLNLISRKADRTSFARYLEIWWLIAIVIMIIFEIVAAIKLWSVDSRETFYQIAAIRMLYIFLMGNLVDTLFWSWGLLTLRVESGDVVREGLQEQREEEQLEHQVERVQKSVIPRSQIRVNQLGTVFR